MSCLETVNEEFGIGFRVTWTAQIGYDVRALKIRLTHMLHSNHRFFDTVEQWSEFLKHHWIKFIPKIQFSLLL